MNKEQIKQYYERIEKLVNGANKETYGFVPEEIRQILKWYEDLEQQNKKYKEVIKKVKKMIIDNIEETTYEYIGSNKIKVLLELRMDNDGVNKLLDILKDVE